MSAYTIAAIGALIDTHRELVPVLEEHLIENEGEVLPHLVMADVVRWLVEHRTSDPEVCSSVVGWLEEEFGRGPEEVRGLITVSGVEMIPDPGHPGAELRDLLGPVLREADPWSA
ncbi:hypothetical protein DL991_32300 [Amycolatopsis sp. WAC 01375]|uniref:DUF7674 family protein n=1 Tax=unclassified Amycolatopsis TaxID=2618356 RepID=UPI000F7B1A4E|nr:MULTISPECIES: hypothetical protein [unclassified Amycolatopsis]RSM72890.1 hypothetical protein DL991_32300 [Amycolatopsis sp. WAC 01375]RSN27231.1 hypothetical protein DL990_28910 [Amycolatopsis sp. WAC 01416]